MKALKGKVIGRVLVFLLIMIGIYMILCRLFMPHFQNSYETFEGFYDQEDDTIEVAFLGTSVVFSSVIPAELYEDYGICSYNFGSSVQPVSASYYWLEEIYKTQSESLTTVVLDVSMFRDHSDEFDMNDKAQIALAKMHLSLNKVNAALNLKDTLEGFIEYISPVYAFHDQWDELTSVNFRSVLPAVDSSARGYYFRTTRLLDKQTYRSTFTPSFIADENAGMTDFDEDAMFYFDQICEFCEEGGIELILVRMPTSNVEWTDADHNAAEAVAEEYDLTYIDFNYSPYLDEVGYNSLLDKLDKEHLNYYGAAKLTSWLGEYLTENCDVTDVRGLEEYSFMEDVLAAHYEMLESAEELYDWEAEYDAQLAAGADPAEFTDELRQIWLYELNCEDVRLEKTVRLSEDFDLCVYLEAFMDEDHVILISAQGDISGCLGSGMRSSLAELGLTELALLNADDSYAALIKSGAIQEEAASDGKADLSAGKFRAYSQGGSGISSILIDNEQYSLQEDGINIVIYNKKTQLIVSRITFQSENVCLISD